MSLNNLFLSHSQSQNQPFIAKDSTFTMRGWVVSHPVESNTTVFEERTGDVENLEGGSGDADLTVTLLGARPDCAPSNSVLALCKGWCW